MNIREIENRGRIRALADYIEGEIYFIRNQAMCNYILNDRYKSLEKCLKTLETKISNIRELLAALNKIQPGHN